MESLSVAIQLTFKDFLNFQFNHLRKRMMPFLVFFILIFIVCLYGIFAFNTATIIEWLSPMVTCLIFPLVLICAIYFISKNSFNTDSFLRKEHVYIFSKEKLKVTTENSDLNIDWKDVYRYVCTKHNLIIYLSAQKVLILPKRFLQDDEQNFILSLLKSEVKQKKTYALLFNLGAYSLILILLLYVFDVFSPASPNSLKQAYELEGKGNFKEAIEYFNRAIEENPKLAKAYVHRGYSKSQLGDIQGYLEDCNKAIEANSNYAEAYKIRGFLKQNLDDSTGACEDFQKAISLGDKKSIKISEEYCN